MGKRSRRDAENTEEKTNGHKETKKSILVDDNAVDPSLALLFASSVSAAYCFVLQSILTLT